MGSAKRPSIAGGTLSLVRELALDAVDPVRLSTKSVGIRLVTSQNVAQRLPMIPNAMHCITLTFRQRVQLLRPWMVKTTSRKGMISAMMM
jgi:hypothetical protein